MMLCFISYKQHKNETKNQTRLKGKRQEFLCLPTGLNYQGSNKNFRADLSSKDRKRPQVDSPRRTSQKKGFYLGGIIV